MCRRRQWSSLTSCRDVAWTEIGHGGNPRSFGNDRRLGDLEGRAYGPDSRRMDAMGKMMQRLTVRADQCHVARLKFSLSNDVQRCVRKPFSQ